MEPIYVGNLVPSMSCYEKGIEKYDKCIKEVVFYEESLFRDFN